MHTIENYCVLIDEWEHNLHSKSDYLSALNHEQQCSPAFSIYLKNFLVPSLGDWPSWYYVKKLLVGIPEESPLLSLIPEQGPFHVTLSAYETAAELHRFFLQSCTSICSILPSQRNLNLIVLLFLLPLLSLAG